MKAIIQLLTNRNFILISALILGFTIGDYAVLFKDYTIYILATVMAFSTTGITIKALKPAKKVAGIISQSILFSYIIHSFVILILAYFLMPTQELFLGFVVIAATPPGVAVIPFSGVFKGDVNYSIIGIFGSYVAAIIFTPLIIELFSGEKSIEISRLLKMMGELIILPMIVSRFLRRKEIFKFVDKVKGKVVNYGFGLIIFTAIGLNRELFLSEIEILLSIAFILFVSIFGLGLLYEKIATKFTNIPKERIVSQNLMLSIKGSGFSVVTAFVLFGKESTVPAAMLSVMVLLYLLFLGFRQDFKEKKILDLFNSLRIKKLKRC